MSQSKKSKIEMLVLLSLEDDAVPVLNAAAKLAEKMNGHLRILVVKEPLDVVRQENQFSAKKELYDDFLATQDRMEKLLRQLGKKYDFEIKYGNVRQNVIEELNKQNPKVTILGKRTKKLAGIIGDRLTQAIIENSTTSVYIVDPKVSLENYDNLTIGLMGKEKDTEHELFGWLKDSSSKNVTFFRMESAEEKPSEGSATNSFIFPNGENGLRSLANYARKKTTHLFCIPKSNYANLPKKFIHSINSNVFVLS